MKISVHKAFANIQDNFFSLQVTSMEADVPYKFNIINCEKLNSSFNFGKKNDVYMASEQMNIFNYRMRMSLM